MLRRVEKAVHDELFSDRMIETFGRIDRDYNHSSDQDDPEAQDSCLATMQHLGAVCVINALAKLGARYEPRAVVSLLAHRVWSYEK